MNNMIKSYTFFAATSRLSLALVGVLLIPSYSATAGTTYDLAADWSDTMNPNGTWSYNNGAGNPITTHLSDWCPSCGGGPQPAWALMQQPAKGHIPVWYKTTTPPLANLDSPIGGVVMHTPDGFSAFIDAPADVTWTSPFNGVVQISGGVWSANKTIGRSTNWRILVDGAEITNGGLSDGDPFTSANPFDFAMGSGGPSVLTQSVSVGDVVALELGRNFIFGWFVGIDLTITELDNDLGQVALDLASDILALDLVGFNGPNGKANKGRRNSLANRATDAADAIVLGDIEGAIDSLNSLLSKVDGQSPPKDWMDSSAAQMQLAADIQALIDDLLLL